jgi:arsenate reductase
VATVLFACTHNAGRSQIAAALFERAAQGRHRALSAGTDPAQHPHPEVVAVLAEVGIDIADRRPQLLDQRLASAAEVLVTMGCGERCPHVPGARRIEWDLPDPKGRPLAEVRALREEIDRLVRGLLEELERESSAKFDSESAKLPTVADDGKPESA